LVFEWQVILFRCEAKQHPAAWQEFDVEVFGGNYHGHHGNKQDSDVATFVWGVVTQNQGDAWPMPTADQRQSTAWLYKTPPLMIGRVGAETSGAP